MAMANNYLGRADAPLQPETWELLDKTMIEVAKTHLSGRKILPYEGPFGLGLKFVPLSTEAKEGVAISQPIPLVEIQKTFRLIKSDLAAYERDGVTLNTAPLIQASLECAKLEDQIIFQGWSGIPGLLTVSGNQKAKLSSWEEVGDAAQDIIKAVTLLDEAGFPGPYALALAPQRYNLLFRRYSQGNQTELDHLKSIIGASIVKAPFLKKGGVLLASGIIYASLIVGQDMTIGFIGPDEEGLVFSVSETLVPLIRQPRSICQLEE